MPEITEAFLHCPYCGEAVEMFLDAAGGEVQEYVEDCEVCCQPIEVSYAASGPDIDVHLRRGDE